MYEHRPTKPERFERAVGDLVPVTTLAPRRERELWRRAGRGDPEARGELTQRNFGLVVATARRYMGLGVPFADIVQEGYFGLHRAIEKFDPSRGVSFSTYAMHWIAQACRRAVAAQRHTIAVPMEVQMRRRALLLAQTDADSSGKSLTLEQLAARVGMTEIHAAEALAAAHSDTSLENVPWMLDEGDAGLSAAEAIDRLEEARRASAVRDVVATLERLERLIVCLRFGLCGGSALTQDQVARRLELSMSRVRRLEASALRKIAPRLRHLIGDLDWEEMAV